jgi:hypothetical protein
MLTLINPTTPLPPTSDNPSFLKINKDNNKKPAFKNTAAACR